MFLAYLKGFGVGAGLIMAIGAQNAYVLNHGIKRQHYLVIPFVCAMCDAVLIMVGVTGVGTIIASNQWLSMGAAVGGAIFLVTYGTKSFLAMLEPVALNPDGKKVETLAATLITTLALTLLNPHVYLDTILLLGSIGGQFGDINRYWFGFGAVTASYVWFFGLSLGGIVMAPLFKNPTSWKVLDGLIGAIMWAIAISLILNMKIAG